MTTSNRVYTGHNSPESTVGQLVEQAVQAVHALNHLTRPNIGSLAHPADAGDLVAALSSLTGGLPQLLYQLNQWLIGQQQADRLRVDTGSAPPDPATTVHAVAGQLIQAALNAEQASNALDAAHQHLARLTTNTS